MSAFRYPLPSRFRSRHMNRTDLNLADLLAQRHAAKTDAYWRDHADTLDEPFRSQLLNALDRFAERRAETQALE